jgi:hypothetical protein
VLPSATLAHVAQDSGYRGVLGAQSRSDPRFQFVEPLRKLAIRRQELLQLPEGAHDVDAHLDG